MLGWEFFFYLTIIIMVFGVGLLLPLIAIGLFIYYRAGKNFRFTWNKDFIEQD